jgi:hypothetical protein
MPKPLGRRRRAPDLRPQINHALQLESSGKSTEAEQLYLAVLAVDPKNSVALYRRPSCAPSAARTPKRCA